MIFRCYTHNDGNACLALFDANCPEYFAVNERDDYAQFLDESPEDYEVAEIDGQVVAAFGLFHEDHARCRLSWIMLDPAVQGAGLGSAIMERVMASGRTANKDSMEIAASHRSAPFFSRFGARKLERIENGWGPGMHRIEMQLVL